MQNIDTFLTLDVYDYDLSPSTIKAIALDSNTRSVTAYITQNGQPYDIGQANVTLTVIRPDGVGAQVTGNAYEYETSVEDTTVTRHGAYAELSPASLAKKGKLLAQFMFTSGEQVLRTEIFTISCGEALDASTDTWAGEYQGYNLDELVQNVNESAAKVDAMEQDVSDLKSGLSAMSTATAEDVGKALKAKTVTDGKVTEWEFGEAGTPSAANWSANAVQLLVGLLQSAVYTSDKSADIEALADELAYTEPTISGTLIKDWQFTGENPLVDKIDGSLAYAGSLISMSSKGAILPAVVGGANAYLSIPLSAYNIDYVGTKVVVNFGEVYLDSMTAGTPYRLMIPCDAENKVSTGQMVGLAYVYQSTKSGDFNGRSFFGIRTSGGDYPFDNTIFGEDNPKLLEKSQTIFYFPDSKTLQITVNGDAVYSGSNKFTSAGIAFGSNRNYVFPCAIKRIRIYKEEQA